MLIGEYQHTLDTKGRISIPAELREDLGERFVISKNLEECLSIYSIKEWIAFEEGMKKMPYDDMCVLVKICHGSARELSLDKQGRVVIPQTLREFAHLEKNVTVVGALDHVEIWDQTRREEDIASISKERVAEIMSRFRKV